MPGRLSRPAAGAFSTAMIEVRVRWRISCRVPLCSVQTNLLAVPLGVGARLFGRIELKALEKLVAPPPVQVAPEAAEEIDDLSAAEVWPQAHLAWHIGETAVQRDGVTPWITAEKRDSPRVGAKQA